MSDLTRDLRAAVAAHAPFSPVLGPSTIRALAENAGGNTALARQLGVTPRTVQRWTKEGGQTRNVTKTTPALRAAVDRLATTTRVKQGADALRGRAVEVAPLSIAVIAYNEKRARGRNVGEQEIDADAMGDVLDKLADGDNGAAGELFTAAYLGAYGMTVDAEITDVRGTIRLT